MHGRILDVWGKRKGIKQGMQRSILLEEEDEKTKVSYSLINYESLDAICCLVGVGVGSQPPKTVVTAS